MASSLLCETVTGQTMAELLAARDAAVTGDMVELRLDGVADLDVAGALAGRRRPAIVTCRPTWEGGRFEASEDERRVILARALDRGAEYVDVEWRAGFTELIAQAPARVVVSSHDFAGVPADLDEPCARHAPDRRRRSSRSRSRRHAWPTRCRSSRLAAPAAPWWSAWAPRDSRRGCWPTRFGSRWTYAGNAVAPGQIPAERDGRARSASAAWDRETKLFGVVSGNAMHSLSPALHNAAFAAAGLDAVYVPFQAADFDDFLAFADALGVEGASVTIPFKLDALHAAHGADDLTRAVGAANTLAAPSGRRGKPPTRTSPASSSRSRRCCPDTLHGRACRGARSRRRGARGGRRADVARRPGDRPCATARAGAGSGRARGDARRCCRRRPGSWDVLVNTTPLGGAASRDESPLPGGPFTGRVVYDLTYGPGESRLVREARARRLPRARRPADARRAGRAAVRVVDRAAPGAGRDGRGDRQSAGAVGTGGHVARVRLQRESRERRRGQYHASDDVRRIQGAGPARARSCPSTRRSWRTC